MGIISWEDHFLKIVLKKVRLVKMNISIMLNGLLKMTQFSKTFNFK